MFRPFFSKVVFQNCSLLVSLSSIKPGGMLWFASHITSERKPRPLLSSSINAAASQLQTSEIQIPRNRTVTTHHIGKVSPLFRTTYGRLKILQWRPICWYSKGQFARCSHCLVFQTTCLTCRVRYYFGLGKHHAPFWLGELVRWCYLELLTCFFLKKE